MTRSATNRDLMNWLLISSDPLVTSIRGWPNKEEKLMSEDAKQLINDDNIETSTSNKED